MSDTGTTTSSSVQFMIRSSVRGSSIAGRAGAQVAKHAQHPRRVYHRARPALSDWEATMNWFLLWLFLHILAAVIAFGPIFVFPIVGSLAAQMPQHLRFAF